MEGSVIAYREIRGEDSKGKNNLNFAKEAFDRIKKNDFQENTVALAFDIKGFFDNLDHQKLKSAWAQVLEEENLPLDHYKIFNSVTKFSFFNREELFRKVLKLSKVKWIDKKQKKYKVVTPARSLKRHTINGRLNLCLEKRKTSIKFLEKHDKLKEEKRSFDDFGVGLRKIITEAKKLDLDLKNRQKLGYGFDEKFIFEVNKENKGIPQGLAVSGLLANIYLLNFDKTVNEFIKKAESFYFRYSDDILVICPASKAQEIEAKIFSEISKFALKIKEEKTNRIVFVKEKNILKPYSLDNKFRIEKTDSKSNPQDKIKLLQYLGLEFDGQKISLRSSSLGKNLNKITFRIKKYHKRFYKNGKRRVKFANGEKIFVKKLREYTHFGKMNFYRYAVKLPNAHKIFESENYTVFKKQLKKQSLKIQKMIEKINEDKKTTSN